MFNDDIAFVTFADTIEARLPGLEAERATLLRALAARRTGSLRAFPRRVEDIRDNLRACSADRAFVTLGAIGRLASAEAEWSLMAENRWEGSVDELADMVRLVAEGKREELHGLVALVVPKGWDGLGLGDDPNRAVDNRARCRIAVAADAYADAEPAWLRRGGSGGEGTTRIDVIPPALPVADPTPMTTPGAPPPTPERTPERALVEQRPEAEPSGDDHGTGVMTSLASVLARPVPPRRPVFGTMVERRVVSLIAAAPGTGKTMLGIQIACAVASRRDWAGFAVPAAGPVVYLNAEDANDEVARRFEAVRLAELLDDEAASRISVVKRDDHQRFMAKASGEITVTDYGRWLRGAVAEIRPALIVIDPMAMTHGLDENGNADMAALAGYFASLATFGDAGVLVIHHAGKDAKAGLWSARGASSIAASVRSMWHLTSPAETGSKSGDLSVQLACAKSNHHPTGSTRSFRRVQQVLANGDTVGLLQPIGAAGGRDR